VRPSLFGSVPFTGQLGTGWTLEAYRGGRLIAFDSVNALGQFSFDLPVQYGENPVDFVAYGPFGEIREFNQAYRIRPDLLQQQTFEYGLSAGACRTDRCEATANVDLRYGLSNRWSARAGLDQFWRDSVHNLTHPYVGITGAISNRLTLRRRVVARWSEGGPPEPSVDFSSRWRRTSSATQASPSSRRRDGNTRSPSTASGAPSRVSGRPTWREVSIASGPSPAT
jgi:hypothetical protein